METMITLLCQMDYEKHFQSLLFHFKWDFHRFQKFWKWRWFNDDNIYAVVCGDDIFVM